MSEICSEYICEYAGCKKCLKDPITLPCGETICREHFHDQLATLKCQVCDKDHVKPKINMKMNSLINKNAHLTGQHKQVKVLFDQLEKEIDDFHRSNLGDQKLYIHEYFAYIRNKIDHHRDQMIESI